ncbi:MAG: alpha/beta fold hydrolase [Desulfomonilia bacterium]|uniref:Alpha/beta hydrolase n=1 Tax=anaerobic digester metagenome TaxID=1263854 RepID=A0A485M1J3_9ZZZZ|nr:alpha/beta fold hydrolase [Pseudomonadota bacterium]HPD20478.1 alpha/beta fold hydrolase [Deltaproteobacteria bacterium]HPX18836.1 alpha/beta fold hydrolase [Deltaproteobacteria bacterium]HRS55409.1 alpha/beta fold hydrolase [Desulfomonilia bacterium]HRV34617.1 alpha/beta fold hydrolase [Desulfomonilia bacterium]
MALGKDRRLGRAVAEHLLGYLGGMIDRYRRRRGRVLDAMGLGPRETPSETVLRGPTYTLRLYGGQGGKGPAVLIVPAPIKRAYIWDLDHEISAVRRFLGQGIRVWLIRWEMPGIQDQGLGLAHYAGRYILDCLEAMESGPKNKRPILAGHSLGGTFAAIFAALHPDMVGGLVLLGAPIRFGPGVGAIDSLVARAPGACVFTSISGNVPGWFLGAMSTLASPASFQAERWADWQSSLTDPRLLRTHMKVRRWTLDELPMPGLLFEEVVERLYRRDCFMGSRLDIDGKCATPRSIRAPILTVADRRSVLVPPEASLPLNDIAGNQANRVLWYEEEPGVALQHVGMLVGRRAHQSLWPAILRWIGECGKA